MTKDNLNDQQEQMLQKYFVPKWWHAFFIVHGWSTTPGESGILGHIKKDGFNVLTFSEPEIQQLIAIDKQLINARSLKSFALLLLFLGVVFVIVGGMLAVISMVLIVTSIPSYMLGIKFSRRGRDAYQVFTKSLPIERKIV